MFHWFPALTQHETPCALMGLSNAGCFPCPNWKFSSDGDDEWRRAMGRAHEKIEWKHDIHCAALTMLNHNYCDHVTVNSGVHILCTVPCTTIMMILVLRYASFCDFSQLDPQYSVLFFPLSPYFQCRRTISKANTILHDRYSYRITAKPIFSSIWLRYLVSRVLYLFHSYRWSTCPTVFYTFCIIENCYRLISHLKFYFGSLSVTLYFSMANVRNERMHILYQMVEEKVAKY